MPKNEYFEISSDDEYPLTQADPPVRPYLDLNQDVGSDTESDPETVPTQEVYTNEQTLEETYELLDVLYEKYNETVARDFLLGILLSDPEEVDFDYASSFCQKTDPGAASRQSQSSFVKWYKECQTKREEFGQVTTISEPGPSEEIIKSLRTLRQQQDQEYEESLKQDQERERKLARDIEIKRLIEEDRIRCERDRQEFDNMDRNRKRNFFADLYESRLKKPRLEAQ